MCLEYQVGGLHQLCRELLCEVLVDPTAPVERDELAALGFGVSMDLGALYLDLPSEQLALGAYRDPRRRPSRRHRRAGRRDRRDGLRHRKVRGSQPEHQGDVGDEAITDAEHRCSGATVSDTAVRNLSSLR